MEMPQTRRKLLCLSGIRHRGKTEMVPKPSLCIVIMYAVPADRGLGVKSRKDCNQHF